MKKRYLLAGLLVLLLAVALTAIACGGEETTTTAAPSTETTAAPSTTTAVAPSTETTAAPSTETTAAPTGEPIKVGHIVNLTGPEAMVGEGQAKTLEAAFEYIGAINGRTVEVITEDAKGEAAAAVDAARKLVENDKVVAIFGPTEIGQKMAVANYIKSAGIPQLTYNPSPLNAFEGNQWLVGTGGATPQPGSVMGDYLAKTLGWKTINTLTEDNSAGRAFMDPLTTVFTQLGGQVAKQAWVPEEVGDFSPYLTTLPAADGLAAWEPGGAGITFWSQWYATGVYKKLPVAAAFHGGFTDSFIPMSLEPEVAAAMVGTPASQGYSPDADTPENKVFQETMTPILGFPPSDDGSSGPWQAALVFANGLKATNGDTSPDKLLAGILGSTTVGPEGTTSFNGSNAATRTYYICEVFQVPGQDNVFTYKTVQTYEAVPPTGYKPQ
jgi:branched-chain amino acid transport system substrate-binding protein